MGETSAIVPMEGFGLRAMQEADIEIFAWWEKSERPYPWTPLNFIDSLNSPHQWVLVLERNGKPAGYAAIQIIGQEAYLLNIMVDPAQRGCGFGKKLLTGTIEWVNAMGADSVFLDVDPSNGAALRLYRALQFEQIGKRPNAYPRGEESMLMRKRLS